MVAVNTRTVSACLVLCHLAYVDGLIALWWHNSQQADTVRVFTAIVMTLYQFSFCQLSDSRYIYVYKHTICYIYMIKAYMHTYIHT